LLWVYGLLYLRVFVVGYVFFEARYFLNFLLVPLQSAELDVCQHATAIISRGALHFALQPVELRKVLFNLLQDRIGHCGLALESSQLLLYFSSTRPVSIHESFRLGRGFLCKHLQPTLIDFDTEFEVHKIVFALVDSLLDFA